MKKSWLFASTLLLSSCAMSQVATTNTSLILKPQITKGSVTQAINNPYDQTSIQHLTLKIFTGGLDTGINKTLLNAQLDNPVVFSNLKANTSYRIKAFAYASADDSLLISTDDTNSWTDVTLTNDDRPTVDTLKVKLIDKAFNGQASSTINLVNGHYSPIGSESLSIPRVTTTLSGNGTAGSVDGAGFNAQYNNPLGMAMDDLYLYIAEQGNCWVRKVYRSTGAASVLCTGGVYSPHGIALDNHTGYLYVADSGHNRIIRVDKNTGAATVFAGNGTAGTQDGTDAQFSHPIGLAVDASGNLYVADTNNSRIRMVTPAGNVTTLAGSTTGYQDGTGTAALLWGPSGITLDGNGNLYIADTGSSRIRKLNLTTKVITTVAGGTGGYQDGTNSQLGGPYFIAFGPDGYLYATEWGNRVRKIDTSTGYIWTISGNGTAGGQDGTGSQATHNVVAGIAIDSAGTIYVADRYGHRIRQIR